ncbi:HupE/UreJ family protein [Caldovatus aquaticus]|uniref:HupE/UreJ family protein n=1 Tax=Caldovatus aquaticus TaxID=2865671 RepID=A0ABS7F325_9PROT|nr:HupE/UreJ family protein [Caldovatus aquaticus]MBW8269226.1 HupE/UreJ family protein [Caldovatus aquaticus]
MTIRLTRPLVAAVCAIGTAPGLAHAHHAMGGATPQSLWQGLASGIGHPVIGLDHLAFLVAAGVLAAGAPARRTGTAALLAFVLAGTAGTLLHLRGIGLGPVEATVALSALGAGAMLLLTRGAVGGGALIAAFALAGLFHGHAYGEAVVGAEAGPIGAYLAGLAAVQGALGLAVMAAARGPLGETGAAGMPAARRIAGAAAVLAGGIALAIALTG